MKITHKIGILVGTKLKIYPMNNTLKMVLLIVGIGLIAYGLYTAIAPEVSIDAGPFQVQAQGDNTQSYAMIGLGVLALIGGIAFKKR